MANQSSSAPTDKNLVTSDVTTNDVSTSKHGFVPKAPNDTAKFLRGDASWASAAGAVSSVFSRTGAVVAATNDYTDLQVQNSPTNVLTTTGDLLYASGANTLARLAAGAAGTVLQGGTTPSWSAALLGGVGWTVVTKASDESVASSTTVQNDDELFFATVSGAIYDVELALIFSGNAAGDFKSALGEDSTVRGWFSLIGGTTTTESGATATALGADQGAANAWGNGTSAANRMAFWKGNYWANGATFRLLWAQATSNVNATIVRAGSVLRYRRIV